MANEQPKTNRYEDPLHDMAGLLTQAEFYERTQAALREGKGRYYMMCVGIEDYKLIAELYGREISRGMLRLTAEHVIERSADRGAFCGRVKGDQIYVLIPEENFSEDNVRETLNDISDTSSPYHIFLHVGAYLIIDPQASVVAICNRANIALDHIEGEQGNCIAYYRNTLTDKAHQRRKVIREVEDALDKEHFQIFLQPQVDGEGTLVGAEALVRWNHPEDGILPPGRFVGILEEAGLIYLIDRYVWELTASQLEDWKSTPMSHLSLSVNISQKDFYYLDIYTIFTDLVDQYNIDPSLLRLEVREDALVTGSNRHLINRLKNKGFNIMIDNFGSGYSSLSMLKDITADTLKIDPGFLWETEELERSRIILDSVIEMCHKLNTGIIVEGVETKDQLDYLIQRGCNAFQGYYFDKPLPVKEFEEKYFKNDQ